MTRPTGTLRRLRVLAVAGLLLWTLAPSVSGHDGRSEVGAVPSALLEAETYWTPDPDCDPDVDGEHTRPRSYADASSLQAAFLPHSGCGLNWSVVVLGGACTFTSYRIHKATGAGWLDDETIHGRLRVYLGDRLASEGSFTLDNGEGGLFAFDDVQTIGVGVAPVRVEYDASPWSANLVLDFVQGSCVTVEP